MSDSSSSQSAAQPSHPFRAVGILMGMNEHSLKNLSGYGNALFVKKGEEIISEGVKQSFFYLILKGRFEMISKVSGKLTVLSHFESGECMGEADLFVPGSSRYTFRAIEDSELWKMDTGLLHRYLSEHAGGGGVLLLGIARQLGRRLREVNQDIIKNNMVPSLALPNYGVEAISIATTEATEQGFFTNLKKQMMEGEE